MTLLIILALVFGGVSLMVFFGGRHAKPLDEKTQSKYSKIIIVLVFASLILGIFNSM